MSAEPTHDDLLMVYAVLQKLTRGAHYAELGDASADGTRTVSLEAFDIEVTRDEGAVLNRLFGPGE